MQIDYEGENMSSLIIRVWFLPHKEQDVELWKYQ